MAAPSPTPRRLLAAVAVVALLHGCSDAAPPEAVTFPPSEPGTTTTAPWQQEVWLPDDAGGTIGVGAAGAGEVLVDQDGYTLYVSELDTGGIPTCTGRCADVWPPVEAPVLTSPDVDATLVGVATSATGTAQATFNGRPLYRYTGDTAPGEMTGHGSDGVWSAVRPDGTLHEG